MNATRLRALQERLGLSDSQMAGILAPQRPIWPQTLRRWKAGAYPIPGWAVERLEALERGDLDDELPAVGDRRGGKDWRRGRGKASQ